MNSKELKAKGYTKLKLLSSKQIDSIKSRINYFYNFTKKNFNYKIKNLYSSYPKKAGNRYDLLNLDLEIQKIFYSDSVIRKIKKGFLFSEIGNKVNLGIADFQILVMLPNTKKEYLGWHQDSAYFKYSEKLYSNLVVWTPISMTNRKINGSLDLIEKSNNIGPINHKENLTKMRKQVSLSKRGKFFINHEKINLQNKVNISVDSGESLIFDANMIHRTSPNKTLSNDIRFTLIARYKNLTKLLLK